MPNLSHQQIKEIVDATDMVSLAGRYVHLTPQNHSSVFVGLCPFHHSTTPTFMVDARLRICWCTECHRTLNAVDFVMEMEHTDFRGAIDTLALAAGINPAEAPITHEAPDSPDNPARMFAANRFALDFFRRSLSDTPEGRNIGLAYFTERGLTPQMIERFCLGYAPEQRNAMARAAIDAGIDPATLVATGLAVAGDHGDLTDRYRGRVVYPVFTVAGEPVAFGARTLRTDKEIAKYVNSPESRIYSKSNELYGLFQAKDAIVEKDRCILVEGYMDVISMYSAGIRNVVASSGTSLTEGQVALIKRFTRNITVIYDADAAGVKASVRSIDMLLAADFSLNLVSLPDGDDPDSFARSHSLSQIEEYLAVNAVDFVQFKLRLGAERMRRDPIERSRVLADITRSISLIPDKRAIRHYTKRTARLIDGKENMEKTLSRQVWKYVTERRMQNAASASRPATPRPDFDDADADALAGSVDNRHAASLRPYEAELLGYVVRNALLYFCDTADADGEITGSMNVAQFVSSEMMLDEIDFVNDDLRRLMARVMDLADSVDSSLLASFELQARRRQTDFETTERRRMLDEGGPTDMSALQAEEAIIAERSSQLYTQVYNDMLAGYVSQLLLFDPDTPTRRLVTELVRPRTILSRIHSRGTAVPETERDRLVDLVQRALYSLKYAIVLCRVDDIHDELRNTSDPGAITELLRTRQSLDAVKGKLAPFIGDVVITSRKS